MPQVADNWDDFSHSSSSALWRSTPYVIAEIGVNHEGSLERAKNLIRLAAEGGASAAKFQAYKAHKLARSDSPAYWDLDSEPTTTQHALFSKFDSFDEGDYVVLASYCENQGIDFACTPFDMDSVDFLDPLVKYHKVASADITHESLLKSIGAKGKPVILSTGASYESEIEFAIRTLKEHGASEICLMHCVLSYPTLDYNAHLSTIKYFQKKFPEHLIGYSDHTIPDSDLTTLTTAYLLGSKVIETHFTDDKGQVGNDHYHALDKADLLGFQTRVAALQMMLGKEQPRVPLECEIEARLQARRSLVAAHAIKRGSKLKIEDLEAKRPGDGIEPHLAWQIVGGEVLRDLEADEVISWNDLSVP